MTTNTTPTDLKKFPEVHRGGVPAHPAPRQPDSRSGTRLMLWIWREQWRSQLTGFFWGITWMLSLALMQSDLQHRSESVIDPLTSMLNRNAR